MAIFKCKMCGGDLNVSDKDTVFECEYCGTTQTIPTSRDEEITNLFNRAEMLRRNCEFDKAESAYEKILEIDSSEAEAYWGVILCRYGVEYVDDPATGKKIPTCHRTSYDAIVSDEHFKSAVKYADVVQRAVYEKEAEAIDGIQKGILELSVKEDPYDIFICYKETDAYGRRTKDSARAAELYDVLEKEGFRVFYAARSLEDKLGEAYEPYIFSALNSAKVMLVIGTKAEYFNAVWVKNEWSRFLKIVKQDRMKRLIPCYLEMDAYDLPEEFAHLQAQDMSKVAFLSDIVYGIKKIISAFNNDSTKQKSGKKSASIEDSIKRAYFSLEEGDFSEAEFCADRCLNEDLECYDAYLVKLLASCEVKTKEGLRNSKKSFVENINYKRAIRFGSPEAARELKELCMDREYNEAKRLCIEARTEDDYSFAKRALERLNGYKDSSSLVKHCDDKIREIGILEMKEAADKQQMQRSILPAAEAACEMILQENKVKNMELQVDKSRRSTCLFAIIASIVCIISFIIMLATGGNGFFIFIFAVSLIATLVLFFIYVKKHLLKSLVMYIVLSFITGGLFMFTIPIIFFKELKTINASMKEIKVERAKKNISSKKFNKAIAQVPNKDVRERIVTLAYEGYLPIHIAKMVAEEEVDYV